MKATYSHRIKNELIKGNFDQPQLTVNAISGTLENRRLIDLISRIVSHAQSIEEREQILVKIKKLVIQIPRLPDQSRYQAEPLEFEQYFNQIKREQKQFNPIKWIDAELDYLAYLKQQRPDISGTTTVKTLESKEWLNQQEVLQFFNFSICSLKRRIGEGLPVSKVGGKKMFNRQKVNEWLDKQ